jgi:DNA-binding MarR family transcriptional regulator
MADERAQLVEKVLDLRADFCRSLRPTREWLDADLTMSQLKVLFLLYAEHHASMTRLAEALHVTLATVTGIVDRLVEHGWIVRDEDDRDRRIVLCALTADGVAIAEQLQQAGTSHLARLLEQLSAAELRLVAAGLEALCWAAWADATAGGDGLPAADRWPAPAAAAPVVVGREPR